jgi:transcriptional regulator with XRE-family HTH domain
MLDYVHVLGDTVRRARKRLNLTQREVANRADIDVRTVLNIENYKGNPKIEILFPLFRVLEIDPVDVFYPERTIDNDMHRMMQIFISECNEQEIAALLPICRTVLSVLRAEHAVTIESS